MPAPKNNTYWQNRKSHGRKLQFKTAKTFQKAWIDYFTWSDKNPWYKNEVIKSGAKVGKIIKVPTKRPYTESGFCAFHGIGKNYITQLEERLQETPDEDFSGILNWARNVCYTDKFEGAATGAYNPMIIVRDIGLKDSQNIKHEGIPEYAPPEIKVYNSGPPLATNEEDIKD